jgi:hypothetical protein
VKKITLPLFLQQDSGWISIPGYQDVQTGQQQNQRKKDDRSHPFAKLVFEVEVRVGGRTVPYREPQYTQPQFVGTLRHQWFLSQPADPPDDQSPCGFLA